MTDNTRGILWALLSSALYALVAALAKVAVDEYHVLQILFFRQIVVLLSTLPSVSKTFPHCFKTNYPMIHAVRLTGAFVALSCGIWAVAVLPLTTAITLGFTQVFFVALFAYYLLREKVGVHRVSAIFVGFIGVVVVTRPGVNGFFDMYALVPILGAMGAAVAVTSVRKLSQTESTATLLVYQAIFIGVLAGIPLLWFWKTPDLSGLILLFSIGAISTIGQWIGVKALRLGEASVIGYIQYVQLIYAALLGFFVFREIPGSYTLSGAAIIILAALYIFHRENKLKVD